MSALREQGGASALPILLATLPSLPRPILARLTARMIDRMDELDGDDDLEVDDAEDAFTDHAVCGSILRGPGCPIADPDIGVDDGGELTDEREPEPFAGGHANPIFSYHRGMITA